MSNPEAPPARCGNCKFFMATPQDVRQGICRRNPPIPIYMGNNQMQAQFPMMQPAGWCGEWKLRLEGLN